MQESFLDSKFVFLKYNKDKINIIKGFYDAQMPLSFSNSDAGLAGEIFSKMSPSPGQGGENY